MGRAIVGGIVLVVVITILVFFAWRVFRKVTEVGDLDLGQERQLRRLTDDAAVVMRSLGASYHIEETDILSDRSRETVEDWLRRYDNYHQKEINA